MLKISILRNEGGSDEGSVPEEQMDLRELGNWPGEGAPRLMDYSLTEHMDTHMHTHTQRVFYSYSPAGDTNLFHGHYFQCLL